MQGGSFDWEPWEPSRTLERYMRRRFRYVFFVLGALLVFVCLVMLHLDIVRGDFQRQMFGILFGCLGGAMIFLSYPAWGMRAAGIVIALLLSLCSGMPMEVLPERLRSEELTNQTAPVAEHLVEKQLEQPGAGTYRDRDLDPLFRKLTDRKGNGEVVGVWMRGADKRRSEVIIPFLKRMSQTHEDPEYHGGKGGGLFIVDKTPLGFKEVLRVLSRVGTLEWSDSSLHFIDVALDRNLFEESASHKVLNEPSDPFYIEANLRELRNLDARRVTAAARRLVQSPGGKDVSIAVCAVLSERLREPWGNDADYVTSLASALAVWAPQGDENTRLLLSYVADSLIGARLSVPFPVVDYLLIRGDDKSAKLLLALWKTNPVLWESRCVKVGGKLERGILAHMEMRETSVEIRESGVRILGKVGGDLSQPLLRTYSRGGNSRLAAFSRLALEEIERRIHP